MDLAAETNAGRDRALPQTTSQTEQTELMKLDERVVRPPRRKVKAGHRWRTATAPVAPSTAPTTPVWMAMEERPGSFPLPGSPASSRIDPHNPPVISLALSVETMDQLVQEVQELATSE